MKVSTTIITASLLVLLLAARGPATTYRFGGQFDKPIPAQAGNTKGFMEDAVIDIERHLTIHDIDLRLGISHGNIIDLRITLISPAGAKVLLNEFDPFNLPELPRGRKWQNYEETFFDDEADIAISEAEPPFTGAFRPLDADKLTAFEGQDAFGKWKLRVQDLWQKDTGTCEHFELFIETPEPGTFSLLTLGLAIPLLKRRRGGRI